MLIASQLWRYQFKKKNNNNKKINKKIKNNKQHDILLISNIEDTNSMEDIIVTNILIQRHSNWFSAFSRCVENEFNNSLEIIFFQRQIVRIFQILAI